MIIPTLGVSHNSRVTPARAIRSDDDCLRYRLDVVAVSVADIVRSAGGWLCDRVMAGWEVTALLPPGADTRALRILGVQAFDADARFALAGSRGWCLAVSGEAFTADAGLREKVLAYLDDRLTEVAVWGEGWPMRVDRSMIRAEHVLSAAARRFKHAALDAAGLTCPTVEPTETLRCDGHSPLCPAPIPLRRP